MSTRHSLALCVLYANIQGQTVKNPTAEVEKTKVAEGEKVYLRYSLSRLCIMYTNTREQIIKKATESVENATEGDKKTTEDDKEVCLCCTLPPLFHVFL